MSTEGGFRAVIAAGLANLGIAITKFVAFALTGSSSMLSEAIHSLAAGRRQGRAMSPSRPCQALQPTAPPGRYHL